MPGLPHTAIYTDNESRKDELARNMLEGRPPESLNFLRQLKNDGRYDKIYNKWFEDDAWMKDLQ